MAVCPLQAQWEADPTFAPTLESPLLGPHYLSLFPSPGSRVVFFAGYAVNGVAVRNRPVRLNSDGSLDTRFVAPAKDIGTVIAVLKDGRVLVHRYKDDRTTEIIRLLDDGTVDPTFSPIADSTTGLAALPLRDGRTLLFHGIDYVGPLNYPTIAALSANGSIASDFQSPFAGRTSDYVVEAIEQSDGRIVIAGTFVGLGAGKANYIARLNANGSVDTTFNANALGLTAQPNILGVNGDGSMVLRLSGGTLVRILSSGQPDPSYNVKLLGDTSAVRRGEDGRAYYLTSFGGHHELRRLNPDGTLDATFVVSGDESAFYLADYGLGLPVVADDGAMYLPGSITRDRASVNLVISRLKSDGTLDGKFAPRLGDAATPRSFCRLPDGKTLVYGPFGYVNGVALPAAPNSFLRLNADGSRDLNFVGELPSTASDITQLIPQPSGKILAVGLFAPAYGQTSIIRFNANGSVDPTFSLVLPWYGQVAVDRSGYVYGITSEATPRLLRYTPDGQIDGSFQSAITDSFGWIVPMDDGSVTLLRYPNFVRLRHDGSIDPTFNPGTIVMAGDVIEAVPLPDGRLMVCSAASSYFQAVRLTATGAVDYNYVGRGSGSNVFGDYFDIAALCFDLLRESTTIGGTANVHVGLLGTSGVFGSFYVDTGGTLLILESQLDSYRRTAPSGPSVDLAPAILRQPMTGRASVTPPWGLSVAGSGLFPMTYQWFLNGRPIPGLTSSSFFGGSSQSAGYYSVTITNAYGSVASNPVAVSVGSVDPVTNGAARLADISSRAYVGPGEETLIAGFAISGPGKRTVLIRGVGPTLADFGITEALADPKLTVYSGSTPLFTSDDWSRESSADAIAAAAAKVGAFGLRTNGKDAALLLTLDPGTYSAQVTIATGAGGIGLVEIYDVDVQSSQPERLINIAARASAQSGERVLTAGFVVNGSAPRRLLIRASGPALANFGVSGVLKDPVLTLFTGQAMLQSNDNWNIYDYELGAATTSVGAFPLSAGSRDASFLITLAPGNYTAQVTSKDGSSGVALVEVYDAPK